MAKTEKKKTNSSISFTNSIKTRLIAIMLLVVIVPLGVSLIVSYVNSTNKALEDAEKALQWQAKYIMTSFSDEIKRNVDITSTVADNPTTIVYMEGTAGITDDVMVQMMQASDAIMDDGSLMAIADTTGMQIVRSSGKLVDVSKREYFAEAMKGNKFVSNIIVSASTGARQITIAVPIHGSDGSITGEVQRNYDLAALHELLASNTDDAFVIDRDGIMAAHAQFEIGAEEEYDMNGTVYMSNDEGVLVDKKTYDKPLIMAYTTDPLTGFKVVVSDDYNQAMASEISACYCNNRYHPSCYCSDHFLQNGYKLYRACQGR